MNNKKNLLLIACSQRKRQDQELLPAIKRYDGGAYRIIQKAERENYLPKNLDIIILSAKYGLISSNQPIPNYDLRINRQRALELQPQVQEYVADNIAKFSYASIYVDLGNDYLIALDNSLDTIEADKVIFAKGRIGQRQRQLKTWLIELD